MPEYNTIATDAAGIADDSAIVHRQMVRLARRDVREHLEQRPLARGGVQRFLDHFLKRIGAQIGVLIQGGEDLVEDPQWPIGALGNRRQRNDPYLRLLSSGFNRGQQRALANPWFPAQEQP